MFEIARILVCFRLEHGALGKSVYSGVNQDGSFSEKHTAGRPKGVCYSCPLPHDKTFQSLVAQNSIQIKDLSFRL